MGSVYSCPCSSQFDNLGEPEPKPFSLHPEKTISIQEIWYLKIHKSKDIQTKLCIIPTDRLVDFFSTKPLFQISFMSKTKEPSLYTYTNIHTCNFLTNHNYWIVLLQSEFTSIHHPEPNFHVIDINFISNNPALIKEQLQNDWKSMAWNKFKLIGVVRLGKAAYKFVYTKAAVAREYSVEVRCTNTSEISKEDIVDVSRSSQGKAVALLLFQEGSVNSYFFILEKGVESGNKVVDVWREHDATENYLSRLTQVIDRYGRVEFFGDRKIGNLLVFNNT